MTVHLGDGAILGVKGEGAPQLISAPENGVTAQYTWLTTSDGALGHLRVAFGRSAPWRRVVLVTDGARALCCGRNIPLRARELLARGGAAEVLAAVRESRPGGRRELHRPRPCPVGGKRAAEMCRARLRNSVESGIIQPLSTIVSSG